VDGLKVVVVRGEGRAFSAGADLSLFAGPAAISDRDAADAGRRMVEAVEAIPAVTVARLHGHCIGGALVLAAACDLRVAAADTTFSIPEIDLGIPLAWGGIPRLVRELGPARTKELVMTGRPFGADEALAAGLLNRVVPAAELDETVERLMSELWAKSRLPLLAAKRHVDAVTQQMVGTVRSWADADGLLAGLQDEESRAAAAAYLERWRGRDED
jgi:enoyl-CoA hydratase/carnithine racemase